MMDLLPRVNPTGVRRAAHTVGTFRLAEAGLPDVIAVDWVARECQTRLYAQLDILDDHGWYGRQAHGFSIGRCVCWIGLRATSLAIW
jgi:hypothetical protein